MTAPLIIETFTLDEIKALIPHRDPMLMIDKMEDIHIGHSAVGIKYLKNDDWTFKGHFPGQPIFPGVLIIEAMAQTAAALVMKTLQLDETGKIVYFMSIDEAKFRHPVLPGDTLKLYVEKIKDRGPIWKFLGRATVGDKITDEAIFTAMIADRT
jgi:3-hydroxyacyl-[acyl-carrier-protein] dehydratase